MPKYLAPIDLQKNELRLARIHNLAGAPADPVEGQIYYDTSSKVLYFWNGTIWVETDGRYAIPEGPATGDLDGTYPAPVVRTGAINNAKIAPDAAIALSKLATDPLARANHTGTQLAQTISDFDQQVRTNRLDQLAVPTGPVSLNGHKLTQVADPTQPQDAATKAYVDATSQGLDVKNSVRVATTGNVTLSGLQTIDGVTVVDGDSILVIRQSNAAENGIYVAHSGAWSRRIDADTSAKVTPGMFTFVEEGQTNHDGGFVLTTDGAVNLGTTALNFTQFSGAGSIEAGTGLTQTGSRIDANGTAGRISVTPDAIDIDANYVGQPSITTLGTIATGTWNASTIAVNKGGTGATTAAGAKTNLGFTTKFSATLAGGATSEVITHNLGTDDATVTVRTTAAPRDVVYPDIEFTSANTVTIRMGNVIAADTYRVTVVG